MDYEYVLIDIKKQNSNKCWSLYRMIIIYNNEHFAN